MPTSIKRILDNLDAYIESGLPDMHRIGLMGDLQSEPNMTHIVAQPSYSPDRPGTWFASIHVAYTYRGDNWETYANLSVAAPRHYETGFSVIRADDMTLVNVTRVRGYGGVLQSSPTDAQRAAAEAAIGETIGAAIGDPVTVDKRTVLTWIENAVTRTLDRDPVTCRDADDYGRAYRDNVIYTIARVLNVYDRPNARRALGHAITDTDQNNLTNRIVLGHKRDLRARIASL